MWPFKKKKPAEDRVWKVEYALSCSIEGGRATFDLADLREDFVTTGPRGTAYDAAAVFVRRTGILPHGYIHKVTEVKIIPK